MMKITKIILPLLWVVVFTACSNKDELEYEDNFDSSDGMDSVRIELTINQDVNTRAGDRLMSDYCAYSKLGNDTEYDWRNNISVTSKSESNNNVMLQAIVFDTEKNTSVKLMPFYKTFLGIDSLNNYSDRYRTFTLNLPKNSKKGALKINAGLISEPHYGENTLSRYSSSLNQFSDITFSTVQEFRDSIGKRFGHNGIFSFNNIEKKYNGSVQTCEYENSLFMSLPAFSFFKSQDLFDSNGMLNQTITIERQNAAVLVLTDEFNDLDPDFQEKLTRSSIAHFGKYPQSFDLWSVSSIDWKSDRKISEYVGDFTVRDWNTDYPEVDETLDVCSYDIPIINNYTHQQYNLINKMKINPKKYSSYNTFYGSKTHEITRLDVPLLFERSWQWYRHIKSGRYFKPVASRALVMPYGRPRTLDSKINNADTHFVGDELDKEIKYLVCNVFTVSKTPGNYSIANPYANRWFRFAYEIPEEGLKPGYLYIIKNRPGTKLFKEWNEATGKTRGGKELDYVLDESCLEIEEIPM